jgi:hypothetical protein
MKKSDLKFMPKFFDRYINLISDLDTVLESLENSKNDLVEIKELLETHQNYRYEAGKWTPKELVQHIIDTERILSYRALVYARNDANVLPGFDENLYANNIDVSKRSIEDLLEEFQIVRASSLFLFKNLSNEALHREGTCFNVKMTSLALGFVIAGHPKHHINILKERYFQ